jgi:hypothetical protein
VSDYKLKELKNSSPALQLQRNSFATKIIDQRALRAKSITVAETKRTTKTEQLSLADFSRHLWGEQL